MNSGRFGLLLVFAGLLVGATAVAMRAIDKVEPETARYFARYDVQEGACFVAYRGGNIAIACLPGKAKVQEQPKVKAKKK